MTLRVAVVSPFEIIDQGLRTLLARFPDRVEVTDGSTTGAVDVVLWSAFGVVRPADYDRVRQEQQAKTLVVLCWNLEPGLVEGCLAAGADGYLTTYLSGEELVAALERVHAGERVVSPLLEGSTEFPGIGTGGALPLWPGQTDGLTEREGDIVALIAEGISNDDVAARLFLSLNTVKSYIRTAYAKMGVESRSQAVLWAVDHGLRISTPRSEEDARQA